MHKKRARAHLPAYLYAIRRVNNLFRSEKNDNVISRVLRNDRIYYVHFSTFHSTIVNEHHDGFVVANIFREYVFVPLDNGYSNGVYSFANISI